MEQWSIFADHRY